MVSEVYKSKSLEEALNILSIKNGKAMVIAGGTDVIVNMQTSNISKEILLDISDIDELKFIKDENDTIKIGAATTFDEIINSKIISENISALKKAASLVGSPQIRSRGTIGGNICNASPSADLIPPLLALDAKVMIQSKNKQKLVYLKDILIDKNHISLYEDEIIIYIEFNKPYQNEFISFCKLGFRKSLSISRISASVFTEIKENKFKKINIALGAINSIPIREYEIENFLLNKEINDKNIEEALSLLEKSIEIRLKNRASVTFKSYAVKGVLKEAIDECINLYRKTN